MFLIPFTSQGQCSPEFTHLPKATHGANGGAGTLPECRLSALLSQIHGPKRAPSREQLTPRLALTWAYKEAQERRQRKELSFLMSPQEYNASPLKTLLVGAAGIASWGGPIMILPRVFFFCNVFSWTTLRQTGALPVKKQCRVVPI